MLPSAQLRRKSLVSTLHKLSTLHDDIDEEEDQQNKGPATADTLRHRRTRRKTAFSDISVDSSQGTSQTTAKPAREVFKRDLLNPTDSRDKKGRILSDIISSATDFASNPAGFLISQLFSFFPITNQLLNYRPSYIWADLVAGATIAILLIPQSIAYSTLARLPPIHGLLSSVFPLLAYSCLGSSRHLSVGPEALTSILVGVTVDQYMQYQLLSKEAVLDTPSVAATLTIMVGLLSVVLGILKAGYIQNLLSGYLLTGFLLGAGMLILAEQIPFLLGLNLDIVQPSARNVSTLEKFVRVFQSLPTASLATSLTGISSLSFLIGMKLTKKKLATKYPKISTIPDIMILVIIMTLVSYLCRLEQYGVKTLGQIQHPTIVASMPYLGLDRVSKLLSSTLLIIIVGFVESQTATNEFGMKRGYFPSPHKELLAIGLSNVVGALSGGYIVFGSLPRSKVQFAIGGKTNLAGMIAGLLVLLTYTFGLSAFQYLPICTRSAIGVNAAINLFKFNEIAFLFRMKHTQEIIMFVASWAATFFFALDFGIIFCIVLSVLLILKKSTFVDLVILGEVGGSDVSSNTRQGQYQQSEAKQGLGVIAEEDTQTESSSLFNGYRTEFVDVSENPNAILRDGMLMIQVHGPLYFYNAGRIRRDIEHILNMDDHSPAKFLETEEQEMVETISLNNLEAVTSDNQSTESLDSDDYDPRDFGPYAVAVEERFQRQQFNSLKKTHATRTVTRRKTIMESFSNVGRKLSLFEPSRKKSSPPRKMSFAAPQVHPRTVSSLTTCVIVRHIDTQAIEESDNFELPANELDGRFALILDFEHCNHIDSAAVLVLYRIVKHFGTQSHHAGDIRVIFSGVHSVKHVPLLRKSRLIELLGVDNVFLDLHDAVAHVNLSRGFE